MKTYNISLSKTGLETLDKILGNISRLFSDKSFKEFLAKKCETELQDICNASLGSLSNEDVDSEYMRNMHTEITDDYIMLYNDSLIDVNSKEMYESTKKNYIGGVLSLAKVVEFGVGIVGQNTPHQEEIIGEWEYDVNNHGDAGWYYRDSTGNVVWTRGYEGKLIFYQLKERIIKNIPSWVSEYIEKNL